MAVAGKQVWAAMTGETNKRNQQPARFVAAVSWPYPRRADSHNPEYDRTSVSVGTFSGTIELPSGWSGYGFLMNGCIDVPPALWRTNLLGDGIRPPSETELAFDATLSQRGSYDHIQGKWVDRSNHVGSRGRPLGGNILFEDGHAQWRDFRQMRHRIFGDAVWDF